MVDKKFCIEYFLTGISEKAINGDKIHKYDINNTRCQTPIVITFNESLSLSLIPLV